MVETEMIRIMKKGLSIIVAIVLSASFALAQDAADTLVLHWKVEKIDGHRTGVTAPSADNVKTAIGTMEKGVYTSPNGRRFKKGATPAVAQLMLDAQPAMASVKEVIGYSEKEMLRYRPQCELSNWFADFLRRKAAELTERKVDVAIYNFGGIRTDMPQGPITVDDIMSMFPFRNAICSVAV